MKQLPIESISFQYLERSFREWLQILGYAITTTDTLPVHVREFFHYLEQRGIKELPLVDNRHVQGFINHLDSRVSNKTGTGLSTNSIKKTITAVNVFLKYINMTGKHFLDITPVRLSTEINIPVVLTRAEIQQLYDASFEIGRYNKAIGQRDRAMLAVFYGCGLRKSEGTRLNITDIDTVKGLVFVRKGKGNKQRYVPIARKALEDIKTYLQDGRQWFFDQHQTGHWHNERYGRKFTRKNNTADEALFVNSSGQRMANFYQRLHLLRDKAGIQKNFSPHTLRHSIATHLLDGGMDIEEIAKFLGHSSLQSTQLYTHIINEQNQTPDDTVG